MSRLVWTLLVVFTFSPVVLSSPAHGQTEGVGVGASIGVTNGSPVYDRNPIGINGKVWVSERQAVTGMTSFFISGTAPTAQSYWILQGDYLFHDFNKLDVGEGLLALYIGAGGQYTVFEDTVNQFAFRSPLGVNYLLGSAPIDVFVEVAPTLRVTDPSALRFDGAIGFRYYFSIESNDSDAGTSSSNAN